MKVTTGQALSMKISNLETGARFVAGKMHIMAKSSRTLYTHKVFCYPSPRIVDNDNLLFQGNIPGDCSELDW